MRHRHHARHDLNPAQGAQRAGLRAFGLLLTAVGGVFTAIGLVSFFGSMSSMHAGPPEYFWCAFVGLPMLGFGTMLLKLGYLGAIGRYVAGESAPVVSDTVNYVAEETRPAMRAVSSAIREGLSGAGEAGQCRSCGQTHDAEARFCDQCGASLQAPACPSCGRENDADARFCAGCGKAVQAAG